jgi:hypothetical protein
MSDVDLGSLFSDFDRRKNQERVEEEARIANAKLVKESADKVLGDIVSPAFKSLIPQVASAGHEAEVIERIGPDKHVPGVTFRFKIRGKSSEAEVVFDKRGYFNVRSRIEGSGSSVSGGLPGYYPMTEISKVDAEWVKNIGIGLIKEALNVN